MELISVLMSVYNETEEELILSIESILKQSYSNLEFVIINDNPSNQQISQILHRYQNLDSRVKLYTNKVNIGLIASLNKAWELATGEYVARMDADDISLVDRFEKQVLFLKQNQLDFIGGSLQNINEAGDLISKVRNFPKLTEDVQRTAGFFNGLCHPTWLMKKEVMDRLHGYRDIYSCEDYDFVLRALANGYKLGNCQSLCLYYRIRTKSISRSNYALQSVTSYYLAKNRHIILAITPNDLKCYLESSTGKAHFSFTEYRQKKGTVQEPLNVPTWKMFCDNWNSIFFWKFLKGYCLQKLMQIKSHKTKQ